MCEPNTGYDWERIRIMPPRMTTRIIGRATAAPRGGRMGGWTGRGGGRTRGRSAYNPKEYDGKGGALVYTRWIEKMESVQDISGCKDNQKVKYTASSFIGKALMWWNSQIHTRSREAAVGMSWEDFKTLTRDDFCPSNELQNLETELWNHVMVGVGHAAYTDKFHELARNVNPVNAKNPAAARRACYKCGAINGVQGCGNNGNQARGRVFMLGAKEVCPDPNIVIGVEPSDLGFSYEIEIASGGNFDVIIGMDWLSNHKAEIICHEKVVRIPLPDGKVLRVIGERPREKMRHLVSAKAKKQKQEELVVVRDFPEVFPDDLSGLTPSREIKLQIELVPGATPVAKSPYRLAPSKMEELLGQLKEL
ncbi:putative reverse transcriptase domain-containing protein [Tanacetum coccineum]